MPILFLWAWGFFWFLVILPCVWLNQSKDRVLSLSKPRGPVHVYKRAAIHLRGTQMRGKKINTNFSPCRRRSLAKKESGKTVPEKVTEASEESDQKVTETVPKTEKSDRTPFADLLLWHSDFLYKLSGPMRDTPPMSRNPVSRQYRRGGITHPFALFS